jgi:hypothetical protein
MSGAGRPTHELYAESAESAERKPTQARYASTMSAAPYRAPPPPIEPDPYMVAWVDLNRRRLVALGLFPLLLILLGVAASTRRSNQSGLPVLVVAVMALIPVFRLLAFRCPQCGDYFTSPPSARILGFIVNPRATPGPFNQRCYSCDIAVGTPKSH